ncbi:hypothetical protein LshimejAT787_1302980 [Lyophyllum shimeji]|uniref:Uncharacterized protein n=1 Tax=Lyophyllum shimeji TaxID=47721 RepID=A0A9P3PY61_LYOSH|nr:hypothetical protein LshimejAT787_1302980 [Lyophyllum shimeji]
MLFCRGLSRATKSRHIGCRFQSTARAAGPSTSVKEYKAVLENDTLYIDQDLAEALGWHNGTSPAEGVPLTLHGWAPHYFAITRTGSESDALARRTVESGSVIIPRLRVRASALH